MEPANDHMFGSSQCCLSWTLEKSGRQHIAKGANLSLFLWPFLIYQEIYQETKLRDLMKTYIFCAGSKKIFSLTPVAFQCHVSLTLTVKYTGSKAYPKKPMIFRIQYTYGFTTTSQISLEEKMHSPQGNLWPPPRSSISVIFTTLRTLRCLRFRLFDEVLIRRTRSNHQICQSTANGAVRLFLPFWINIPTSGRLSFQSPRHASCPIGY